MITIDVILQFLLIVKIENAQIKCPNQFVVENPLDLFILLSNFKRQLYDHFQLVDKNFEHAVEFHEQKQGSTLEVSQFLEVPFDAFLQ